jgi:hypothetical protein
MKHRKIYNEHEISLNGRSVSDVIETLKEYPADAAVDTWVDQAAGDRTYTYVSWYCDPTPEEMVKQEKEEAEMIVKQKAYDAQLLASLQERSPELLAVSGSIKVV